MRKASFFIFLALILSQCASKRNISATNLAHLYKKAKNVLDAEVMIVHKNAVESELYFEVNSNNLLYAKKENEVDFIAKIKVSCFIYESFDSNLIIDSATTTVSDTNNQQTSKLIFGNFPFQLAYPADYIAKVKIEDLYRKSRFEKIIRIQKKSYDTRQNFIISDPQFNHVIFNPFIKLNQTISIRHFTANQKKLLVNHYYRDFELPPPPFANNPPEKFEYEPDSTFYVILDLNNAGNFTPSQPGIYHFRLSTETQEGFTIFCFQESFPKLKNYQDMVQPIRYISSNKEFEEVLLAQNTKKAIDEFWLKFGGNTENAKMLIKNYYHLVEDANKYFTSFLPGWKTDRGMMYIVFGPPDVIYQNQESETWIYGEENSPLAINLLFIKVVNPFTDNDFRLSRSPIFKNPWYASVDRWRQGKIINRYD